MWTSSAFSTFDWHDMITVTMANIQRTEPAQPTSGHCFSLKILYYNVENSRFLPSEVTENLVTLTWSRTNYSGMPYHPDMSRPFTHNGGPSWGGQVVVVVVDERQTEARIDSPKGQQMGLFAWNILITLSCMPAWLVG